MDRPTPTILDLHPFAHSLRPGLSSQCNSHFLLRATSVSSGKVLLWREPGRLGHKPLYTGVPRGWRTGHVGRSVGSTRFSRNNGSVIIRCQSVGSIPFRYGGSPVTVCRE